MALNNLSSMARLDRLSLAIGEERFAQVLFEILRTLSSCRQCFVFAFEVGSVTQCMINVGEMDAEEASRFSARYVHGLYSLDPAFPGVLAQKEDEAPRWFHNAGPLSSLFKENLIVPFHVTDMMGFATAQGPVKFYTMLVKGDLGPFTSSHEWLVSHVSGMLCANLRKNFSYLRENYGNHVFYFQRVIANCEIFSGITEREKSVCKGILTGLTSEGIATELNISINSVLTYRKRIYDKLKISSQNELFDLVLQAAVNGDDIAPMEDFAEALLVSPPPQMATA